jgi:hypothetical protein
MLKLNMTDEGATESFPVHAGLSSEFIKEPQDSEQILRFIELDRAVELSKRLTELEAEVSSKVLEEQEYAVDHLSKRAEGFGLKVERPVVHYIDSSKKKEVEDLLLGLGINIGADHSGFALHANAVVFVDSGTSDLDKSRIAYHEIDHLYSLNVSKVVDRVQTPDGQIPIAGRKKSGANIETHGGRGVGYFFEEGAVKYDELNYVMTRGRSVFEGEYNQKLALMEERRTEFIRRLGMAPKHPTSYVSGENGITSVANRDELVTIFKQFEEDDPGFSDKVAKARCDGNWNDVRESVDGIYGRGAFSILFSLTRDEYDQTIGLTIMGTLQRDKDPVATRNSIKTILSLREQADKQ